MIRRQTSGHRAHEARIDQTLASRQLLAKSVSHRLGLASGVWRLATLTALAVSAGCADLQWQKAGATAEALETDLAECRGEARMHAGPDPRFLRPDAGRIVGVDSASRPVPASSGRLDGDRFLVEHDLTRICMNRRGYELAPATR
jgi:hypothetical protein